jgi:5-methylthioadenosine/S-adenosylhomocysteine deaminase
MRLTAPVVLPCDERCTVLRDAVVDVGSDGRILHVGPANGAPAAPGPELALTGILLPGLVNTHAHTAMTGLRGLGGDLPLMRWLTEVIWPAEARVEADDVYAGMLVGALEMLGAGITTSVEMYFHNDAVVAAVLAVGSRALVTPGIIAVPGWDRLGTCLTASAAGSTLTGSGSGRATASKWVTARTPPTRCRSRRWWRPAQLPGSGVRCCTSTLPKP